MQALAPEPARTESQNLTVLLRENRPWVEAMARRHLGDPALAEEVTQDVFLRLSRLPRGLEDRAALRTWLLRTVWYLSANARRKAARRRSVEAFAASEFGGAAAAMPAAEEWPLEELAVALDSLPALERMLVLEHYFEGREHGEIGLRHRLSGEAARKRISRALNQMRSHLTRRGLLLPTVAITGGLGAAAAGPAGAASAVAFSPGAMAGIFQSPLKIAALTAAACAAVAVPALISQHRQIQELRHQASLTERQPPPVSRSRENLSWDPRESDGGWTPQNLNADNFPNVPPMAQWLVDSLPALAAAARGDSGEPLNLHVSITMSESITRLIRREDEEISLHQNRTLRAELMGQSEEKPSPIRFDYFPDFGTLIPGASSPGSPAENRLQLRRP